MSDKRLLLLSNSTNSGESYFNHAKDWVAGFLTESVKEVLFIPYADVRKKYDEYTGMVNEAFSGYPVRFTSIHTYADPVRAVSEADAIAVGGGNTFKLLQQLYHFQVMETLVEKVNAGMPYIGWSAGANVACPTMKTTNDMPVAEPPSFTALNLVPFQINAHYTEAVLPDHRGETRRERLEEFIEENPGVYVAALPEGTALRIAGSGVALLGNKKIKVFRKLEELKELGREDYLDFLMARE